METFRVPAWLIISAVLVLGVMVVFLVDCLISIYELNQKVERLSELSRQCTHNLSNFSLPSIHPGISAYHDSPRQDKPISF